jgi:3-hydroxybutyryl-CoA dehydrogenase
MKNVAVIGAGTMGNGIAHCFAQHGFSVTLIDVSEEAIKNGLDTIGKNLDRLIKKEKITSEEKKTTINNISTSINFIEAIKNVDLVIEAATENEAIKLAIFRKLDKYCLPSTILASNTSSISITKIAAVTNRPEKVIGMHFMNPVPLMKLVEIIKGYATSSLVCEAIEKLSKQLEKIPVVVNDAPGFVANRILMPMINEAIITLQERVAGVEEIDTVMKLGMAHQMGPLQLADFIGLDVCLAILNVLHEGLGNPKYAPSPLLVKMVAAGKLGKKSGEGFYDWSTGTKEFTVSKKLIS